MFINAFNELSKNHPKKFLCVADNAMRKHYFAPQKPQIFCGCDVLYLALLTLENCDILFFLI